VAAAHLESEDGVQIEAETLRRWMLAKGCGAGCGSGGAMAAGAYASGILGNGCSGKGASMMG